MARSGSQLSKGSKTGWLVGLGWVGLGWVGLGWVGLGWLGWHVGGLGGRGGSTFLASPGSVTP